jgi:hypothetical protein
MYGGQRSRQGHFITRFDEPMILDLKPILQVMTQNTSAGMFKFSDHLVHIPHRPWSD